MVSVGVRRGGAPRRDYVYGGFLCVSLFLLSLIAPDTAAAATYRWQANVSGTWNEPANWTVVDGPAGAGYPNLPGDAAVFDVVTGVKTIAIPDTVTVAAGRLSFFTADSTDRVEIVSQGSGRLVLDNAGGDALITSTGEGAGSVSGLVLNANLSVDGAMFLNAIGETGGARNLTIAGTGNDFVTFGAAPNTYTGTTTVVRGWVLADPANTVRFPGPLVIATAATASTFARADIPASAIAEMFDLSIGRNGQLRISGSPDPDLQVDELVIEDGSLEMVGNLRLTASTLTMRGGRLLTSLVSNTEIVLLGGLTATSTTRGAARIQPSISGPGGTLTLTTPVHDFVVDDGPQAIDAVVGATIAGAGSSVRKLGSGTAQFYAASYTGATTIVEGTLHVSHLMEQSAFSVAAGATLAGGGKTGPVNVAPGGTLSPGSAGRVGSAGTASWLYTGSVTLTAGSHFVVQIEGTPGITPGYDRLYVTGTVDLGNATLDLSSVLELRADDTYTLVHNDGVDPVVGAFAGWAEGATIETASGARLTLSYRGGDGNDVVLTNVTPVSYFLSEGATGAFFDEDIAIANPHDVAAPITMTFFLPGGGTVVQQRVVPPLSRMTVAIDQIPGLEATSPSVEVRSDNRLPLAVERTMFWDANHYGGHTANAVRRPERQWLFAEGAQGFFDTYLLLANPNDARPERERDVLPRERAGCRRQRRAAAALADHRLGARLSGARRPGVRHHGRRAAADHGRARDVFRVIAGAPLEGRSRQRRHRRAVDAVVSRGGRDRHVLQHVHPVEQSAGHAGDRHAEVPASVERHVPDVWPIEITKTIPPQRAADGQSRGGRESGAVQCRVLDGDHLGRADRVRARDVLAGRRRPVRRRTRQLRRARSLARLGPRRGTRGRPAELRDLRPAGECDEQLRQREAHVPARERARGGQDLPAEARVALDRRHPLDGARAEGRVVRRPLERPATADQRRAIDVLERRRPLLGRRHECDRECAPAVALSDVRIGGRAASRYRRDSMRHQDEQRDWTSRRGVARAGWLCGVLMLAALIAPSAAHASTYRWQIDGDGNWNVPANWTVVEGPAGAGYPNLPGDVAVIEGPFSGNRIITIPDLVTVTIGRLVIANPPPLFVSINRLGSGNLVFDNGGGNATVENTGLGGSLQTPIQLNADLIVTGPLGVDGISETGGARNVTLTTGTLTMGDAANTYTGVTTISDGSLIVDFANPTSVRIPGSLVVGDGDDANGGATASLLPQSIASSSDVLVRRDGTVDFNRIGAGPILHEIDDLTVQDGTVNMVGTFSRLQVATATMQGGQIMMNNAGTAFILRGTLTATSSATETAVIPDGAISNDQIELTVPVHDVVVADGPQAIDLRIDAPIIGNGFGVHKLGAGIAVFNGVNTYTGATTVTAGTLLLNGTQQASAVTVAGGTLGGSGSIGSVTATAGAVVSPGAPSGTAILTTRDVSLAGGVQFAVDMNGSTAGSGHDQLLVVGSVTLGGAILALNTPALLAPGGTYTIIDNDLNDPIGSTFGSHAGGLRGDLQQRPAVPDHLCRR